MESAGFHICTRDTDPKAISATGFWLSTLFSMLLSKRPAQTNVILDSCASGGMSLDLGTMLRGSVIGPAGSPSVAVLAMCASDEYAGESATGGFGTTAFLNCVTGSQFVQDSSASLDLMDIGRVVAKLLGESGKQSPCLSALHVTQRTFFCKNPQYERSARETFAKWNARSFLTAIEPVLLAHAHDPAGQIESVRRLSTPLLERSRQSKDVFLSARISSCSALALLPQCDTEPSIAHHVDATCRSVFSDISSAIVKTARALEQDEYALVSRHRSMADLYYLPIRICELIGWLGVLGHLSSELDLPIECADEIRAIVRRLIDRYSPSITVMSDSQAAAIAVGISGLDRLGVRDECETLLSLWFNSVVQCKGQLAGAHINAKQAFQYLSRRNTGDFSDEQELVARPSEAITVLLKLAPQFGLSRAFDLCLVDLDHVPIFAFFCEDYSRFADERIEHGTNANITIGHEFWRSNDLGKFWPAPTDLRPQNRATRCASLFSALIFPDRVPWFAINDDADRVSSSASST